MGSLVAVALGAPLVSSAAAAEVRLDRLARDCTRTMCPPFYSERLVVRALPGEANRLTVGRGAAGELQITDMGAPPRAGSGCTAIGEDRVECPTSSPLLTAFVFAGDGNDTVSSSVEANVDGGGGNDRLGGSPQDDALYAGRGRDVLRGGDGDDALEDGRLIALAAADWVTSDYSEYRPRLFAPVRPERDVFDGGTGADTLGYTSRPRRVVADLSRTDRHAGARGEGDSLSRLEGLVGTAGNDRLFGNDSANSLTGRAGDDLLVGGAGDDRFDAGTGSNRARGGAGDDDISVLGNADPESERQRVGCGPGRDYATPLFRYDFAEDDCETVVVAEFSELDSLLPVTRLRRPPLVSYSTHPVDCEGPSCNLRLDVRLARAPTRRLSELKGLVLGRATATIPFRGLTTLTAHLSARGSRLLRRHRSLLVRISFKKVRPDVPGFRTTGSYLTRLRAPPDVPS